MSRHGSMPRAGSPTHIFPTHSPLTNATVPSTVVLTPLPVQIIQIIPGFEGFLFFILPDGTIVIVSPATLKVVLIIYA